LVLQKKALKASQLEKERRRRESFLDDTGRNHDLEEKRKETQTFQVRVPGRGRNLSLKGKKEEGWV